MINIICKPTEATHEAPPIHKGYGWRRYANLLAILPVVLVFISTAGCQSSKAAKPPAPPSAPAATPETAPSALAPVEEAPKEFAKAEAAPEPLYEEYQGEEEELLQTEPDQNPLMEETTDFPEPEEGEYTEYIEDDFDEEQYTRSQSTPDPPAPQPQSVQIRRKGKSYDIIMNINPGDENVYVQMDIPDEEGLDISTGRVKEPESAFNRANKSLHKAQKHFYKRRYRLGLSEINKALVLTPDFAYAHALKGSLLYKMKKTDLAVQAWQTALEYDPSMDDVRQKLEELGY